MHLVQRRQTIKALRGRGGIARECERDCLSEVIKEAAAAEQEEEAEIPSFWFYSTGAVAPRTYAHTHTHTLTKTYSEWPTTECNSDRQLAFTL